MCRNHPFSQLQPLCWESFLCPCLQALSHNVHCIPNADSLVPATTRAPAFPAEQAPIHPRHKLRMPPHHPHFTPHPAAALLSRSLHLCHCLICQGPNPTSHIITCTQQHIPRMRTPSHLSHRILMAKHHAHRALCWCPHVEGADETVHARGSDEIGVVLVPIMG